MTQFLYVVRNWADHFEKSDSRKTGRLTWLATPVKHDGLGYRRMMAQRDGPALFGAWNALIQTAAKAGPLEVRGRLERDACPLSPDDIAMMTSINIAVIDRALEFFSDPKQGWLDKIPLGTGDMPANAASVSTQIDGSPAGPTPTPTPTGHDPTVPGCHPDTVPSVQATEQTVQDKHNTRGARAREGGRTLPALIDTPEVRAAWARWIDYLCERRYGRMPALQTLDAHVTILTRFGPTLAVAGIQHAITRSWGEPSLPHESNGKHSSHQRTAGAICGPREDEAKLA